MRRKLACIRQTCAGECQPRSLCGSVWGGPQQGSVGTIAPTLRIANCSGKMEIYGKIELFHQFCNGCSRPSDCDLWDSRWGFLTILTRLTSIIPDPASRPWSTLLSHELNSFTNKNKCLCCHFSVKKWFKSHNVGPRSYKLVKDH